VEDNIRAMLDGADKVATGTERVVNLYIIVRQWERILFFFFVFIVYHKHR